MKKTTFFKIFITAFLLVYTSINTFSQHFAFDWVSYAGGSSWDLATDMVLDTNKNLYVTGGFSGVAYFGNDSLVANSYRDIFVAKYDSIGNIIWLKTIAGNDYDTPSSISIAEDNNIFLTGCFSDNIVFDNDTIEAKGFIDNFILKLDVDGQILDYKQISIHCGANKRLLVADQQNNVYFASSFQQAAIFEQDTILSNGKSDVFIIKYDQQFNMLDYFVLGGTGNDKLADIKIQNNKFYLTSNFENEISILDTTYYSYGGNDILTIKIDTNWDIEWAAHAAGFYSNNVSTIELDQQNNTYISGHFNNKIYFDFQDSLCSNGIFDVFVAKYDSIGKLIWADNFGGVSNDYGYELLINNNNNLYVAGTFRDVIKKNGQRIKSKDMLSDMFIAKYSQDGNFEWISQSGGNQRDYCNTLLSDQSDYLYLIGSFNNNFAFETDSIITDSITNANPEDLFVARFFDCDMAEIISFTPSDTIFCNQGQLYATEGFRNYKWNNNKTWRNINIYDSAYYYVQAVDQHNCLIQSDSIFIPVLQMPEIMLGADQFVVPGEIIELDGGVFDQYLWNTRATTQTITIAIDTIQDYENIYTLIATYQNICTATEQVAIYVEPPAYSNQQGVNNTNYTTNNNQGADNNAYINNNIVLNNIDVTEADTYNTQTAKNMQLENNEETININSVEIQIYPNPSAGMFIISLPNNFLKETILLEITNEEGKLIHQQTIDSYKTPIKIKIDYKGLYLATITYKNIKTTQKIIIQ